jgi:hypothetical protein
MWDREKICSSTSPTFAAMKKIAALPEPSRLHPSHDHLRHLLGQVLAFYDRGNYEGGRRVLGELEALRDV